MKGKPWTVEEEKQLEELVKAGTPLEVIAAKLGRRVGAVAIKCQRLGLKVVVAKGYITTTSIQLPKELPSIEEALKMLAGALGKACDPGLDKVEVQRLQVVATLARAYKDILADYLDYRGIEAQLLELRQKYAELGQKAQNVASK
jgi:hypothetical protein